MSRLKIGAFLGLWSGLPGTAHAGVINVTLDTTALVADVADQTYGVDFFMVNGDLLESGAPGGPHTNPSNIVTISNFDFGGGFGFDPATDSGYGVFGGASGDIRSSVNILDNRQGNELFQDFFPGTHLSFTITYTNNVSVSNLLDYFEFGITDGDFAELPTQGGIAFPSFLDIVFDSSDPSVTPFGSDPDSPTSAGEFLTIDAPTVTSPSDTPEPRTFWILGVTLLLMGAQRKIRGSASRILPGALMILLAVVFAGQGLKAAQLDNSEFFHGTYQGRPISYQVINGFAVTQGDMVIGTASLQRDVAGRRIATMRALDARANTALLPHANTVNLSTRLWPQAGGVVTIPYTFVKGKSVFMPAITEFNRLFAGKIQWVVRTNQRNYVEINLNDQSTNSCFATLGYAGGKEIIQGVANGCGLSANMHEMGHVIGLAHEHARQDRNQYMFVNFANLAPDAQGAYAQDFANNMDLGLYDYVSLMHYAPRGFSRNGNPDMESIPVGLPFGDPPTFSPGDYDAINRLYFTAPTQVTVMSNPAGLPIIVDGATLTAPQTFSWALNSVHTLNVPPGPQTIGGSTYIFGRWNNDLTGDLNPSRSVTVTPGSGLFGSPASSPANTVYAVNYIHLVQFNPTPRLDDVVSTATAAGSVSSSPAPATFPGLTGQFLVDRALVTLTATPASGNSFYAYGGDNTSLQTFGPSTNPVTLPADMIAGNFFADFSSTAGIRITTNITDNNASGVQVTADGTNTKPLPAAFALPFDTGWDAGSTHSLTAASPVSPVNDPHTKYTFTGWTDGFTTPARNIQVPASGFVSVGANYNASYHVTANVNTACGGSVMATPVPGDGFVASGTSLNIAATPMAPWLFASWGGTLSTSVNPLNITVSGEVVATANFNLTSAPLTITSIAPASFAVGSPAQTVTVTGTGFTPADTTFFLTNNFLSRNVTYVNATTINVDLLASDFATAGVTATTVENSTSSCLLDVTGPSLLIHP